MVEERFYKLPKEAERPEKLPTCLPGSVLAYSVERGYYCKPEAEIPPIEAPAMVEPPITPYQPPGIAPPVTIPTVPTPPEMDLPTTLEYLYPEMFEPDVSFGISVEDLPDVILENLRTWAVEEPETFIEDLWGREKPEQARLILRQLGASEEDIDAILAPPVPFEIPPEGYQFVEEVEGIRKLFTIKPDFTVWLEGENIGTYNLETGEIIPGPAPTFIEVAKEGLGQAWREYMAADAFSWGGGGRIALAALGVAGSYIETYVGRPWETAILEARCNLHSKTILGQGEELNQEALDRLAEAREKYGFWGALISEDVPDIWHNYIEKTYGPANAMLKVSEWLNPAYFIPIGGVFGLSANFTSKIPLIGRVVRTTAGGVQYVRAHTTLKLATYGTKGIERFGERIGEAAANRLIKGTKHLEALMDLPESEMLLDGVLIDNWIRRSLTIAAKVPPIRKGIEKSLGWRILAKRQSQAVEDIVARAGVIHSEIMRRGPNAKAIKVWELREISGNPIRLFGFNDKAFAPRIRKLVKEADGTLENIFTHPERYALSDKQLKYVTRVHEINTEIVNFLKKEGVALENVGQDWWIHRVVVGKFDANAELIRVRGRPGVRAGRIGAKPSFEMHRKAPTMAEGIEWGVLYSKNPEEYISTFIEEAFKKVADARVAKYVEAFGVKPSDILAQRFPELVGRAALTEVELGNAAYFQSVINRAIRGEKLPEQTLRALERRFPELGRQFRGLIREPIRAEAQLREILAQNQKTIKQLTARLEKAEAVDIAAIRAEAVRIGIPDDQKLTDAFRLMEYEDRLAFRSTMETQLDDIGRMLGEQGMELRGIQEFLKTDAVALYHGVIRGKRVPLTAVLVKGQFPETFSIAEARMLMMGKEPVTIVKGRVPRSVVVDELADHFKMTEQQLIDHIEFIFSQRATLKDLRLLTRLADSRYTGIKRMIKVLDDVDSRPEFVPKAEAGMPEAGLQQDMFGFQKPVFPKGKGVVTQIGMDDYEKLVKVRKDAGLPPPEVSIKPQIEGVKGLEAKTTIGKVSYEMPAIKTVAQRKLELEALRKEVRALTEARKAPYWKARTEKAEKLAEIRQPGIEKGYIMQPFAGGKIYDRAFIDAFNKFFGYEKGIPGLQVVADVAGILRITKAALDLSAMAIQGLPSWGLAHTYLISNPEMGAKLCGAWYKTFFQSSRAFFNPDILAKYVVKNKDLMAQMVALGSSARSVDYFAALGAKKGIGGLGEAALRNIPLKPYHRAEIAFFGAGQMIRTEFARILLPKAIKRGQEIELMRILDRMTGITDPATLGVPLTIRQLEQSAIWFAPSYTRACLTVLADIFRGGMTGEMARRAIGGLISAGAIYYSGIQYAIATIEGKDNEQAWNTVKEGFCIFEDPITKEVEWRPSGRFMTLKVGNYYMGVGGFWYGLIRLAGNVMACVDEVGERERIDLVRIIKHGSLNKRDNPFIYWWYSRAATTFGLGFELASGREFLGYPLETPQDYIEHILKKFEPIWMEQGINPFIPGMARENEIPEGAARQAVIPAEILGLRTFPEGQWIQFYDKVKDYINRIPEEELDEKQKEAWREGKLEWRHLTDIQKTNLLSRYPDVLEVYEQAQADSQVRQSPHWEAWTERQDEERTIYYERGDQLVERVISGELDTREFREKWGDAGQNYGVALDMIDKDPAHEAIYDYFDKMQSERGERYGFVADLALAEYIDIMFTDYTDEKGDYDWNARDVAVDALIEKWGIDYYETIRQMYAQKRLLDDMNPVLIRLSDDKDKLGRGYWRLPYKPIMEMDEDDGAEGNIPTEHYSLWEQYQALPDVDKEAFIEAYPELAKDWRAEFRLANPENDAMLALWGYGGKLQSREAYDLVVKWGQELGIPLEQMGLGLPPPSLIDSYFELNKIVAETSGSSVEAKLYKLEHPEYLAWGLEQGIWTDDGRDWNERVLRLNKEFAKQDGEYDALETNEARDAYLEANLGYHIGRRRRDALNMGFPQEQMNSYIYWYTNPSIVRPDNWEEKSKTDLWYEDDWYLMKNKEFYNTMVNMGVWGKKDFSKVPTEKVFLKYRDYLDLPVGSQRNILRWENLDLDAWLVLKFGYVPIKEKLEKKPVVEERELTELEESLAEMRERLEELK